MSSRPLAPTCPVHQVPAQLRACEKVYGRVILQRGKRKQTWCCPVDGCDHRVGCHPGTNVPLGTMADAELRSWRSAAHRAFDPLWKARAMSRFEAYPILAEHLGLRVSDTHIAMFDVARCMEVVAVMAWLRPEMREDAP